MGYWSTTDVKSYDPIGVAEYCMAHMGPDTAYRYCSRIGRNGNDQINREYAEAARIIERRR